MARSGVLSLDDYQSQALTTSIAPRVYTEDQVNKIVCDMFDEHFCSNEDVESCLRKLSGLLDEHETAFSRLVYPLLGLLGEAGEIANKVKKVARDDQGYLGEPSREALQGELGDVQWYVAAVATAIESKLGDIGKANLAKLADRRARGVISGSGDNR